MKKFSTFWHVFQRSLLEPTYYRDIAKTSYWFSFKYLFFLLICLSLIRSVQLGVQYAKIKDKIPSYISVAKNELLNLYPKELELRISNGKLYTNVEEPYVIEFPRILGDVDGKHMIVIDTKGSGDEYPKYNALILVTRQALVYPDKQQGGSLSTRMYYFKDLKRSLYIDYTIYKSLIRNMDPFIAKLPQIINTGVIIGILLLPLVGGFFWTSSILFGLIFLTLFVWLIEKIMKTSYKYKTLFRMGIHGSTWPILFVFLMDSTNKSIPYLYNIIFIVWMTIILYYLREKKSA